jgi:tetratricopeptide (TPR) repeat protein
VLAPLAGCQRLQARVELEKGNALYESGSYRAAIEQFERGLELDPRATFAWRSVGFAALASYRPDDATAENARYAQLAIEAFDRYLVDHPDDRRIEEFLITTLLEAQRFDEALDRLRMQLAAEPENPAHSKAVVAVLLQAGRLEEAHDEAIRVRPPDPVSLYSVGVAAWEQLQSGGLAGLDQREAMLRLGQQSLDEAISVRPDYAEAMVYLNLLYRQEALLVDEPEQQQAALAEADRWFQKAAQLRNQRDQTEDLGS